MITENQNSEKKSLKIITRNNPDWDELAKDCVCFANSNGGGSICIGIEDKCNLPPPDQRIPRDLPANIKNEIVQLISRMNEQYQLSQKEIIVLGLIAQYTTLSAVELSRILSLEGLNVIRSWMGRLQEMKVILKKGKTKGVEYYVNTEILRQIRYKGRTNLKKIEDYRLRELIIQDLKIYPDSPLGAIHERIGKEIRTIQIRKQINELISIGKIKKANSRKYRTYSLIL